LDFDGQVYHRGLRGRTLRTGRVDTGFCFRSTAAGEGEKSMIIAELDLARGDIASRVAAARRDLAGATSVEDVLSPEESANGAFFYFELRRCVNALRLAREAGGLSQEDIAAAIEVPLDTVVKLEEGMTNPSWKLLGDYAHAVGLILTLTAEPKA
jgi:DNA-binding XRE family transcriptional regulator